MDEAEQNQHEAHLRELFDSFDVSGTGTLGQAELTDLCRVLHLEEVAPGALQQALLQENRLGRVRVGVWHEKAVFHRLYFSGTLSVFRNAYAYFNFRDGCSTAIQEEPNAGPSS